MSIAGAAVRCQQERMRPIWFGLGISAVGLGIAGIFLPLLPTTPFLLLAAYSFSRSSPALHQWLVSHPKLGPPIVAWERDRAISRKGKKAATLAIAMTPAISWLLAVPAWVLAVQIVVLAAVLTFIWTRREPAARR